MATNTETDRFVSYMNRVVKVPFPYTTTVTTVFTGTFSKIIQVSVIVGGCERLFYTPWSVA